MIRSLAAAVAPEPEPTHDCGGDAVDLPHHELRRARDLVGDGDLRRVELVARRVVQAVEIEDRGDAGDAERDVGRPEPPRTPERVRHDDADLGSGELAQPLPKARRRRVGVEREQHERVRALRVRGVHPGRGTDEAVTRLGDDEWRPGPHDLTGLAKDHLRSPGITVTGELERPLRRLDALEVNDATLDLRHRLLRDDDDIVPLEPTRTRGGVGHERTEVVALLELRDPAERDHAQLAGQASPVTLMPA